MKDDKVLINHILDEVNFILKETKDLEYDSLIQNEVLKRAILRRNILISNGKSWLG